MAVVKVKRPARPVLRGNEPRTIMIDNDDDDDEQVPLVLAEETKLMHPEYNLPVFLIRRLWKPRREVEDFAQIEEASE